MDILSYLFGFLLALIICPIVFYFLGVIESNKIAKKYKNGKHHCNECELSFIYSDEEIGYKYCPYCGKKLEHYYEKEEIDN